MGESQSACPSVVCQCCPPAQARRLTGREKASTRSAQAQVEVNTAAAHSDYQRQKRMHHGGGGSWGGWKGNGGGAATYREDGEGVEAATREGEEKAAEEM